MLELSSEIHVHLVFKWFCIGLSQKIWVHAPPSGSVYSPKCQMGATPVLKSIIVKLDFSMHFLKLKFNCQLAIIWAGKIGKGVASLKTRNKIKKKISLYSLTRYSVSLNRVRDHSKRRISWVPRWPLGSHLHWYCVLLLYTNLTRLSLQYLIRESWL